MIPLLVGAAIGAAKYKMDQDKEARQRRLQAETLRYSPWSKLGDHARAPTANANPLDIASGAYQGYNFGQQFGGDGSEGLTTAKGTTAVSDNPGGAGQMDMYGDNLNNQSPWMRMNNNTYSRTT